MSCFVGELIVRTGFEDIVTTSSNKWEKRYIMSKKRPVLIKENVEDDVPSPTYRFRSDPETGLLWQTIWELIWIEVGNIEEEMKNDDLRLFLF